VLAGSTVSRALSVADSVGVAVALGLGEVDASPDPGADGASEGSEVLAVGLGSSVAVALGLGEVDASPDPGSDGETSQGSSVAAFDCAALADGSPVVAWAVPDSMRAAVVRAIRVE